MPTILHRLPGIDPNAAGLTPIDITDDEVRLYKNPALTHWIDGSSLIIGKGARDRKSEQYLTAARTALPTKQTLAAYNNKPALVFGSAATNGDLTDAGQNWLPVAGSFSVVMVGRSGPGDNAYMWGNDEAPTPNTSGTFFQHSSDGSFAAYLSGVNIATVSAYKRPYSSGPTLSIFSFDNATKIARLRLQRGAFSVSTTVGASVTNNNGILHVGAAGAASAGTVDAGDIGALQTFNVALHAAGQESLLALVESVLGTRYGIAAP